jgi:hypothetical protein
MESEFVKALLSAGVIPPNCKRCIIDIPVGGVIYIHTECFGDERLESVLVLEAARALGAHVVSDSSEAIHEGARL